MRIVDLPLEQHPEPMPSQAQRFIRKLMPFLARPTPRDATLSAVERMALTSPHLLNDLGFFRDPQRDTGGNAAWVRGNIEVQVNVTLHRAQARRISLR